MSITLYLALPFLCIYGSHGGLLIQVEDSLVSTNDFIIKKSGAVFRKIGTPKIFHHTDSSLERIFVANYDLLELVNTAHSYKNNFRSYRLQHNLNRMFGLCDKSIKSSQIFSPFYARNTNDNISLNEALEKSESYLDEILKFLRNQFDEKFKNDIQSKTYSYSYNDEERSYFYPTIFENFDDMKEFLKFNLECNLNNAEAYINISMVVPYADEGILYEIHYIPVLSTNGNVTFLEDQSITHFIYSKNTIQLKKNLDNCRFKKEILLCDEKDEIVTHLANEEDFCIVNIFEDKQGLKIGCEYSSYEAEFYNFTSLNNGHFYYLFKSFMKFWYECSDGDIEMGYLFGKGILSLSANCSLTTANENLFYDGDKEEHLIFITEDSNENELSLKVTIAILSITGVFLLLAFFIMKQQSWIKDETESTKYINVKNSEC